MSTPLLVEAFYKRIWDAGDLAAASELLSEEFCFRGSLRREMRGREAQAREVDCGPGSMTMTFYDKAGRAMLVEQIS